MLLEWNLGALCGGGVWTARVEEMTACYRSQYSGAWWVKDKVLSGLH